MLLANKKRVPIFAVLLQLDAVDNEKNIPAFAEKKKKQARIQV
jgi:hypothetical protein|tara:strand:- start:315 stop:443 length:129 start_codon:yes stop_codon:yes gene_type:complete